MHLGSLKVFCDVARNRSFSQAAHVNHVTQSAVSQIISQLERRMDVQLIDRSTRPLQLTNLGRTFYEGCKSLLQRYAELETSIRSARAEIAGNVQVAAIYSVGLGDMGQYVERLTAEEPGVQVHIEYLHPDRVYEKVLDGTADLGLVSFPRSSPKLAALPWREEEFVVVCPPRHPFAGRLAAPLEQLAGQKFVHFERDLVIRKKIDRFLKERGVGVEVSCEFDNIENIKQAVAVGAGIALLPEPTVRREVKNRSLLALPLYGERFVRPLGIIHRRRQKLSAAVRRFIEILCDDGAARNGDTHFAKGAPFKESRAKSTHRAPARA
ncbi:MAG: LysR family transcriptional regulator [Gemmataceae bacterium]